MVGQKLKLILLPNSFNLELHIAQYPPEQYGFESGLKFNKEKAYCFLELITSIASRNPDIVTKDGYTPINQRTIKDGDKERGLKCIKDIKAYIDYLKKSGVILCNDKFNFTAKKSLGYKWAAQYSLKRYSVKFVECKYSDFFVSSIAQQYRDYPYLFYWYQQNRLMIDDVAAENYAFQLYQEKMNDTTKLSWIDDSGEEKDPESQYRSAVLNIAKIKYHQYEAHIDFNVHRLHSAFTGLGKKYRHFVTYGGEKLACIDITNSQPFLVSLLLNKDFWSKDSTLPINIKNLPREILIPLITPPESIQSIRDFVNTVDVNKFTEYKNLVSSGKFYEKFIEVAKGLGKTITREEAKVSMFYTIYSSNKYPKDPFLKQMKIMFTQMFPEVAELFKLIKHEYKIFKGIKEIGKQHNKLACLLQTIEAQIILHNCCKRIWDEGEHKIPIVTIHDSIVTTFGNEDYVSKVMEEELEKVIKIKPTLNIERFGEKESKHPASFEPPSTSNRVELERANAELERLFPH